MEYLTSALSVSNQVLMSTAFSRGKAKAIFDGGWREFKHRLDALHKTGRCNAFQTLAPDEMGRIAFRDENYLGINRPVFRLDTHHSPTPPDQRGHGGFGKDHGAVGPGQPSPVGIIDGSEYGITMVERIRILVGKTDNLKTVMKKKPPPDQAALIRSGRDGILSKHIGLGQILGKVDATRPVFGTGVHACLQHQDRQTGPSEGYGSGGAGGATTDNNRIKSIPFHGSYDD